MTHPQDYRLERWIAIFLSLLFFLPFIVQALEAAPAPEESALVTFGEQTTGTLLLETTTPGHYLPAVLESTAVEMKVTGIVNRARVTQRFNNPTTHCVAGRYVFPLPEDAAVDGLRIKVGSRVIEGEVREREEAKKIYEEAQAAGVKASLVEQHRPNVFSTSVTGVRPGESIEVEITYQQTVRYDAGRFSLRFPSIVAGRYLPPSTGQTATTQAGESLRLLAQGSKSSSPLEITIAIEAGITLQSIESAYHAVVTEVVGHNAYRVKYTSDGTNADHDFELSWTPQAGANPSATIVTEKAANGETFALMMVLPPARQKGPALPRQVIYIIDSSGSMEGDSMAQAKLALDQALSRLDARDSFNVIDFDDEARALFSSPEPGDAATVAKARQWASSLEAGGGTEMLGALQMAMATPEDPGRVQQIVFVTDGQVGNESELFSYINAHLGGRRLFTIGIGAAPNSWFMRGAARSGRGTYTHVGSVDEVAERMDALFRKLESPVLGNIAVDLPEGSELAVTSIGDLYADEPIVIPVRLGAEARGEIKLRGRSELGEWTESLVPAIGSGGTGIARLWARERIEQLTDDAAMAGSEDATRPQILALALEHQILSQYTSLVAVDRTPQATAEGCVPQKIGAAQTATTLAGVELPQTATSWKMLVLAGMMLLAASFAVFRVR